MHWLQDSCFLAVSGPCFCLLRFFELDSRSLFAHCTGVLTHAIVWHPLLVQQHLLASRAFRWHTCVFIVFHTRLGPITKATDYSLQYRQTITDSYMHRGYTRIQHTIQLSRSDSTHKVAAQEHLLVAMTCRSPCRSHPLATSRLQLQLQQQTTPRIYSWIYSGLCKQHPWPVMSGDMSSLIRLTVLKCIRFIIVNSK